MKKSRKGKGGNGNKAIALNSPAKVKAIMANIAKIDWSNPYKDFIK